MQTCQPLKQSSQVNGGHLSVVSPLKNQPFIIKKRKENKKNNQSLRPKQRPTYRLVVHFIFMHAQDHTMMPPDRYLSGFVNFQLQYIGWIDCPYKWLFGRKMNPFFFTENRKLRLFQAFQRSVCVYGHKLLGKWQLVLFELEIMYKSFL